MKTTHEFNSSCFEGLWINKCRAFSMRATHEIIECANPPFNTLLMWNCPKIWTVTEGCWEEAILKIRWMVIDYFFGYWFFMQADGLLHTTCGTPNYVAPEVHILDPIILPSFVPWLLLFWFPTKENYVSFSVFILLCFLDQKWHGVLATTFSKAPWL